MMKNAIILHGTQGSPDGNWFRWLESELVKQGMQVWLPCLPGTEKPSLAVWRDFVLANCPFGIDEDTLVVGHSSGAILALILTQSSDNKIGKVVGVSVFHDNSLGWDANDRLFDVKFDWTKIKQGAKEITLIHSDNDLYVPLEQAKFVAENIGAKFVMIPGQGHFNLEQSANYKEFPYLLALLNGDMI